MAMLERRTDPTPKELRWFGLVVWPMFLAIAALLYFKTDAKWAAGLVLGFSTLALLLYSVLPPVRKPTFVAWMTLVYPLGWVMSHLLLGVVYFLVVTPIGLLLRAFGRDALERRPDPKARSYWVERAGPTAADRYFRQF